MNVRRGNVVILDFPQAPGHPPKRRPALVVQADHNNSRLANSIFAMVTSNIRLATSESAQVLIDVATPDGQRTGLTRTSAVKCENLYTLPQATVLKTIGQLSPPLLRKVDDALKVSLGLP
jgi:mRNA interferase MazF